MWILRSTLLARLGKIGPEAQVKQETTVHKSSRFISRPLLVNSINLIIRSYRKKNDTGIIKARINKGRPEVVNSCERQV